MAMPYNLLFDYSAELWGTEQEQLIYVAIVTATAIMGNSQIQIIS